MTTPEQITPERKDERTLAAKAGKARYFDGKACVHGHVVERYTRNATCVECQRANTRANKAHFRSLMEQAW